MGLEIITKAQQEWNRLFIRDIIHLHLKGLRPGQITTVITNKTKFLYIFITSSQEKAPLLLSLHAVCLNYMQSESTGVFSAMLQLEG